MRLASLGAVVMMLCQAGGFVDDTVLILDIVAGIAATCNACYTPIIDMLFFKQVRECMLAVLGVSPQNILRACHNLDTPQKMFL